MISSLALILLCAVLVAVGVYLILERSLSRIVLGIASLSNGINIVFLIAGGHSGEPSFVGSAETDDMADPLAQAMMLTSIVITLALTGFLLAMAYRSWQLRDNDEVRDDLEDRLVALRAAQAEAREERETDLSEVAAQFHDDVDDESEEELHERTAKSRAVKNAISRSPVATSVEPSSVIKKISPQEITAGKESE